MLSHTEKFSPPPSSPPPPSPPPPSFQLDSRVIEGIALGDPSVKDKRILKVNCIRKITFLPPTDDFGDRRGGNGLGNGLENDVDGMDGKNSNDFADLLATYLSVRIYSSFVFLPLVCDRQRQKCGFNF